MNNALKMQAGNCKQKKSNKKNNFNHELQMNSSSWFNHHDSKLPSSHTIFSTTPKSFKEARKLIHYPKKKCTWSVEWNVLSSWKRGNLLIKSVFGSIVAGAFQITFRAKIHANDFFYFLKIIFNISISKRSKTYKSY